MPDNTAIGRSVHELDTPALLLDLDACATNLQRMADFFADRQARLRPHFKNHKCPTLALRQLAAGSAVGMTCAHLSEAEALAEAGCGDILIANQVVGSSKLRRLIALASRCVVAIAVDDVNQARKVSEAAAASGVRVGLLLEVDIGMGRCGVAAGEPALSAARELIGLPGTEFRGLQAYEGHTVYIEDAEERRAKSAAAMQVAIDTKRRIEQDGIEVGTISGSSSSTYAVTGVMEGVTEVQAGTYATMDWRYQQLAPEFEVAQSILATVISRRTDAAVLDVGVKAIGSEFGPPRIKSVPAADIPFFGAEEHCVVRNPPDWSVGDTVEVVASHACTSCNLYGKFHVHQRGVVVDEWLIEARR